MFVNWYKMPFKIIIVDNCLYCDEFCFGLSLTLTNAKNKLSSLSLGGNASAQWHAQTFKAALSQMMRRLNISLQGKDLCPHSHIQAVSVTLGYRYILF